jgi:hypothetical protein
MDIASCQGSLLLQYAKTPALSGNVSKLTSLAWGTDKTACLSNLG